jgi:hypothetical protein
MNTNLKSRMLQMAALIALVGSVSAFKWGRPGEIAAPAAISTSDVKPTSDAKKELDLFIDNMIGKLTDSDFTVRRCAARALGRIGHAAKRAVPSLLCALGDENASVREAVEIALDRIDPSARSLAKARHDAKG